MVPVPWMVTSHGFAALRGPSYMPATVWLAFMVTVNAGVPVPLLTAKSAAVFSTQFAGEAVPVLFAVSHSLFSQV
jgi:hypothetical protein